MPFAISLSSRESQSEVKMMYFCRDKISGGGFPGGSGMTFRIFEE
jgi:hypothetical protein